MKTAAKRPPYRNWLIPFPRFSAALLFFFGRSWRPGRRICLRLVRLIAAHAFLKAANSFAKAAHHVGNSAPAEKDQHDHQNDQEMWNTQRFHTNSSLRARIL